MDRKSRNQGELVHSNPPVASGFEPLGGGEVLFSCPIVRELKPVSLLEEGKIKRIRGLSLSCKVSPFFSSEMVEKSRSFFHSFIPDVFIYSDNVKGKESGFSPGFSLSLVAESTSGCLLSSEVSFSQGKTAEEVANLASFLLLKEIKKGAVLDVFHHSFAFLFMALSANVSKLKIGQLDKKSIQFLRLLKMFFNISFKLKKEEENKNIVVSCRGIGYKNWARKAA